MTPSRAILFLAIGQTVQWGGLYYLFPALLLRWEAEQGWPKTALTAAFAGAVVVSALMSPVAGRQIDHGRGPALMALSVVGGAALLAALPLAGTVWTFAGLWFAIGVTMAGCLYEPCFALITRTRGADARRGITLVTLVAGFAGTLSFPLNHAVAETFGWRAATLVYATLMVLVALPLTWFGARHLEERRPREDESGSHGPGTAAARSAVRTVLRTPAFWLLALGLSMLALNHGVVLNHILPILADRGLQPETAVFAASMIGPMQVAGRLAMMAAERHVTSHAITVACFAAVIVATACLFGASASSMLIVLFVILQGSGNGVLSIMKPVVTRDILGDRNFGTISGALAVPYLLSFALAPFLGSLLWAVGGYDLVLPTVGGLALLGLAAYLWAQAWHNARAGRPG